MIKMVARAWAGSSYYLCQAGPIYNADVGFGSKADLQTEPDSFRYGPGMEVLKAAPVINPDSYFVGTYDLALPRAVLWRASAQLYQLP